MKTDHFINEIGFNEKIVQKGVNIVAKACEISEFFSNNSMVYVPRYQRGYSWESKNVLTFIDDVKKSANGYFYR